MTLHIFPQWSLPASFYDETCWISLFSSLRCSCHFSVLLNYKVIHLVKRKILPVLLCSQFQHGGKIKEFVLIYPPPLSPISFCVWMCLCVRWCVCMGCGIQHGLYIVRSLFNVSDKLQVRFIGTVLTTHHYYFTFQRSSLSPSARNSCKTQ